MNEKQTSGKALAKAAEIYMRAHSSERFSLETMAKSLYVNGSYLLRTFKHHTGMTPLYYHHRVRCEKAKELLAQTDMEISRIGEVSGYVTPSHFTYVFRKMEGCTPRAYRKRYRTGSGGQES